MSRTKMKFAWFFALMALVFASMSCPASAYSDPAISLQHLLTEKDCESVPELLGDWQAGGDLSGTWTIQKLENRAYRLVQKVRDSGSPNKVAFDFCVAHLGGYLFFDATFQQVRPDGKSVLGEDDDIFWIPFHLIGKVDVEDNALHFLLLDDGWLQDGLKSGRLHLTCSQDDEGQYLLTAPSKELKEFATRFASDAKAFSYEENFERAPQKIAKKGNIGILASTGTGVAGTQPVSAAAVGRIHLVSPACGFCRKCRYTDGTWS